LIEGKEFSGIQSAVVTEISGNLTSQQLVHKISNMIWSMTQSISHFPVHSNFDWEGAVYNLR
jgi:hypothetical protein